MPSIEKSVVAMLSQWIASLEAGWSGTDGGGGGDVSAPSWLATGVGDAGAGDDAGGA
jgi:hypothetical protein